MGMEFLLLAVITLIASVFRGLAGVFSLIYVPLALFFVDAKELVVICLVLGTFSCLALLLRIYKHVDWSIVKPIFLASIPGSLLGLLVYLRVDTDTLKLIISIVVILAALFMISDKKLNIKNKTWGCLTVGFLSGILGPSTSLSGPPVLLYLVNELTDKDAFRATLNGYFILNTPLSILLICIGSRDFNWGLLVTSLQLIPVMLLGLAVGMYLFKYLSSQSLARLVLMILIFSSLYNIYMFFVG